VYALKYLFSHLLVWRFLNFFEGFLQLLGKKGFLLALIIFLCNINVSCIFWVLLSEYFYFVWIGFFKGLSLRFGRFRVRYYKGRGGFSLCFGIEEQGGKHGDVVLSYCVIVWVCLCYCAIMRGRVWFWGLELHKSQWWSCVRVSVSCIELRFFYYVGFKKKIVWGVQGAC